MLCTSNILALPHTASSDYVPMNTVLTFPPGSTRQCADVMILDDDVVEIDEVINLLATLETSIPLVTVGGPATITIIDGDGEYNQEPPRLPNTQFTQNKRHYLFSSLSLFVNSKKVHTL